MERSFLGCLLEQPDLIGQVERDISGDLLLSDHYKLWRAMTKLHSEGVMPDVTLLAQESSIDCAYIAGLLTCGSVTANFQSYLGRIQAAARERRFHHLADELTMASTEDRPRIIRQLTEAADGAGAETGDFHRLRDIPKVQLMTIEPMDEVIPNISARKTVSEVTGAGGSAKSAVILAASIAVAKGEHFLGLRCQQSPVLIVDYENPPWAMRNRIDAMTGGK